MLQDVKNSFLNGRFIHAVNFHHTPKFNEEIFEKQLSFFQKYFSPVSIEDLNVYFDSKKWKKDKPGLLLNFYNGYRNNYDVIYPLLEKYEFTGWFFVASKFITVPVELQKEFADSHTLSLLNNEYKDGRVALSKDELRALSQNHVIASHTKTHSHISIDSFEEVMRREIVESKHDLEEILQDEVSAFAWLGGKEFGFNPLADQYITEAGYHYLFSNLKIQKVPLNC